MQCSTKHIDPSLYTITMHKKYMDLSLSSQAHPHFVGMCTFPSSRMSDRISLTWSEFQKFVATSFANARSSSDFSDVTLVGEDYQLEAHRLVLSAGSRFFHDLFKRAKHDHPLVYLKGTFKVEIEAILSFLHNALWLKG